jgi:predicted dehydrogenase
VIEELAKAGFRKLIVEKPLAAHHRDLNRICWLRKRYGLDLVVVSHWLTATLTERMLRIADSPELGTLRTITVHQHKPRFLRSLTTSGHPTAFDVEIPHSLAAVLKLAGPATLLDADWTTMRCQDQEIPRLGGARIALEHASGARSDLVSDLMSPRRERRITLRFEHGTVVGDYPLSEDDDHAQLRIEAGDRHTHAVFRDDALASFFRRAYTHFHRPSARLAAEFALHREAVRLLCTAKNLCAAADRAAPSIPAQRKALSHRAGH